MPCMQPTLPTVQFGFLRGKGLSMEVSMVAESTGSVDIQEMAVAKCQWSWVPQLGYLENGLKRGNVFSVEK